MNKEKIKETCDNCKWYSKDILFGITYNNYKKYPNTEIPDTFWKRCKEFQTKKSKVKSK